MTSQQERKELDERAKQGEEVVEGGRGEKCLEAQKHLAEGRSTGGKKGGSTRKEVDTQNQKAGELQEEEVSAQDHDVKDEL